MKRSKAAAVPGVDLSRFEAVPRDVRLTANGKTVMVFAIVFAAGAVMAAVGLPAIRGGQAAERAAMMADATPVSAIVTGVTSSKGENPRQVITYRYSVDGRDYEGTFRLREKDRRPFPVGGHLSILYRRSQPSRSWLPGSERGLLPMWVVPLVTIGLLLPAAAMAWTVRRARVLLSEGRFTAGRVLEAKKVQHSHHQGYQVRYEFRTLSGATVTARVDAGRPAGSPGDTIAVVYHRDNPRWNAIYPMSLATPERR